MLTHDEQGKLLLKDDAHGFVRMAMQVKEP
jgi:hypothetical protein